MSLIPEGKPRGFCKCGCGQLLKTKGSRFLLGHSWRDPETKAKAIMGQKIVRETTDFEARRIASLKSPLVRAKISKTLTGRKATGETVRKQSESQKLRWENEPNEVRIKYGNRLNAVDIVAKRRATLAERWQTDVAFKTKMLNSLCAVGQSPEVRTRAAETLRQNWAEHKPELLKKVNAHLHKPEVQAKARASFLLRKDEIDAKRAATLRTPEVRCKIARALTGRRQPRDVVAKRAKKTCNLSRPTRPEIVLGKWLEDHYPNEWRYNGGGADGITICGHVPDYVNINGKKIVCEVFGDYWHDPIKFPDRPSEQELTKRYAEWGYKCLILWEKEVYNEVVLEKKVKEFVD